MQCKIYNDEATEPISHLIKGEDTPSQFTIDQTLPPIEGITHHFGLLIGEHESLQEVYYLIEKLANNNASVIIRGESGTGKELVARAIHQNSQRGTCPYITINCAAIPENLIESELFGHEKGAFTGAYAQKRGKIEEAHTGTLFLDEVGELSPMAQAKLLRFLQEKTFARVGANKEIRVDARIIAATNKDLEEEIQEKKFRVDLYFRLRVVQIEIAPLRERSTDIPMLIQYLLKKISEEYHLDQIPTLTPQALNRLIHYQWPGNVRQLENSLYRAFITAKDPHVLDEGDFDLHWNSSPSFSPKSSMKTRSLPSFDELSKEGLLRALEQCNWDTKEAARLLKVSRGTIYYKLKKFQIHPRHGKSSP